VRPRDDGTCTRTPTNAHVQARAPANVRSDTSSFRRPTIGKNTTAVPLFAGRGEDPAALPIGLLDLRQSRRQVVLAPGIDA